MGTLLLFLLAFSFSFFSTFSFSPFSPVDNHLINCGSSLDAAVDARRFVSDFHYSNPGTPLQSSALTTALCNGSPGSNSPQIYHTARVFRKPSRYAVEIKEPGTHMARFHVLVDNYVALSNFTVSDTLVKEYLVWVSQNKLVITIVPTQKGKLGFVNGIEVLSAPKDLIPDTATLVRDGEEKRESYGELNYSE
ncbi:unnamed protein product [Linum trigynum]|uniref:Malectin-like domain-containing protein n=1 Tax=Linum trigynum TaxID=586398 RepID=A0AAV2EQ73_9ROSI